MAIQKFEDIIAWQKAYLSEKLDYLSLDKKSSLVERANEISKMIRGLIKSMTNAIE